MNYTSRSAIEHVLLLSGGIGSFGAALRMKERDLNFHMLFCDTSMEDEDLYRFLINIEDHFQQKIIRLKDGRTPWKVFKDVRYLGNSRIDPCSRILKRETTKSWIEARYRYDNVIRYVGFDWTEEHRLRKMQDNIAPWKVEAPLIDTPVISKWELKESMKKLGIALPRLYDMGFDHNNCGGFCVKAGQGHFYNLLKKMPERYAYHENEEQKLRGYLDKDISFLTRVVGGMKENLTLKRFRELVQIGEEIDKDDIGGCSCFVEHDE